MVEQRGTLRPKWQQIRMMMDIADESFCRLVPEDFGTLPTIEGFKIDETALALKGTMVNLHTDPWCGSVHEGEGENGPEGRRAVFWLVEIAKGINLEVLIGGQTHQMSKGDWILFDDRLQHSVRSERVWRGCAFQVRPDDVVVPIEDLE